MLLIDAFLCPWSCSAEEKLAKTDPTFSVLIHLKCLLTEWAADVTKSQLKKKERKQEKKKIY